MLSAPFKSLPKFYIWEENHLPRTWLSYLRTHSAGNISLFCAPGMTVGSRKEAVWAWQFSEETILHSVLSNTMVALVGSERLQGGDWEQKAHNRDSLTVQEIKTGMAGSALPSQTIQILLVSTKFHVDLWVRLQVLQKGVQSEFHEVEEVGVEWACCHICHLTKS